MGQMSVGGGHSNLEEVMCTIGVPSISKPTFIDIERLLGSTFEDYLNELMLQAGRGEKVSNTKQSIPSWRTSYCCNS